MRAFSTEFAAHIASGATTLARCWRIARTDGVVLGFTDHDQALSFEGTVFTPAHGLDGSEATGRLGPQIDTSEVLGVLHAEAIAEADIVLGRYDGAEVETWQVDWADVSVRALLRRDTIGEIVREDGVFRAELRSGQQALNIPKGRLYQGLCDAMLGDARCGVALAPLQETVSVVAVLDRHRLAVSGLGDKPEGWADFGALSWTTGVRTGLRDGVVRQGREGGADIIAFERPVGEWVVPGDAGVLVAGCDKRFATCRDRFANGANFRGFPHIPGNDFVLKYPRQGDALGGGALVK